MILTPSQGTPVRNRFSQTVSGLNQNPGTKPSPHNRCFTRLAPTSVTVARAPGEKEQRRTTCGILQLGSTKICPLKVWFAHFFFFPRSTAPTPWYLPRELQGMYIHSQGLLWSLLATGPAVGVWEQLFLTRETELEIWTVTVFSWPYLSS